MAEKGGKSVQERGIVSQIAKKYSELLKDE